MDWYSDAFAEAPKGAVVGEKTPTYGYLPVAAERIWSFDPNMKLVWVLRDPAKRAYSQYWHAVNAGGEWRSFERAVEDELKGRSRCIWNQYIHRSMYAHEIMRFQDCGFTSSQMLFLKTSEMLNDPNKVAFNVAEFVGAMLPNAVELPWSNPTRRPVNRQLHWSLRRVIKNRRLFQHATRPFKRRKTGYPPLPESVQALLDEEFAPENARLFKLTGLDIRDA